MKMFTLLLALLAGYVIAATTDFFPTDNDLYIVSASDAALQDLPIVDMTVTDDRFPDRTFTGTAAKVLAEMIALKPELFNNTSIDDTSLSLEAPSTGSASDSPVKRACCGEVNCKTYYPSNKDRIPWGWCVDGITHLKQLDKASCTVSASPACARVSCSHKCGMFLCSKIDKPVSVYCGDIAKDINMIGNTCNDGGVWGARNFDTHFTGVRRQEC